MVLEMISEIDVITKTACVSVSSFVLISAHYFAANLLEYLVSIFFRSSVVAPSSKWSRLCRASPSPRVLSSFHPVNKM
jgi:hypothetical protein